MIDLDKIDFLEERILFEMCENIKNNKFLVFLCFLDNSRGVFYF